MVWPEGNENWSGGSRVAQQCGSRAFGRFLPVSFLQDEKDNGPGAASRPRRGYRLVPRGAAQDQDQSAQPVPEPAVAPARSKNHPEPEPARRPPTVNTPHQPMVARGDVIEHVAGKCHALASPGGRPHSAGGNGPFQAPPAFPAASPAPREHVLHHVVEQSHHGNRQQQGGEKRGTGFSSISAAQICNTSRVKRQKFPDSPSTCPRPRRRPSRNSALLRAPGTCVQTLPSERKVCASLPPSLAFPEFSARRSARRLLRSGTWPLRTSTPGKAPSSQTKVLHGPPARQGGKGVIHAVEQLLFVQVGQQAGQVIAQAAGFPRAAAP
jgi:hypothetical protein